MGLPLLHQRCQMGKEDLALRIETAHLRILKNFIASYAREPQDTPKVFSVADGFALVTPLATRFVPNVDGYLRYRISSRVLDELEECSRGQSASLSIELCSESSPTVFGLLSTRGYRPEMPADVLVSPMMSVVNRMNGGDNTVQRPGPDELQTWAQVLAHGFEAPELESTARYFLACGLSSCAMPLLARFRRRFAGAGLPACQDGVGWLFAFSTLPAARQRGVQTALITTAVQILRDSGCDVAAAEAAVGTSSHRNFQRQGFKVLYQRWDFTRYLR
jgi:GNAT superfamily N-acetyltransferase